ncbi:folate-binding protein YgfZ [Microbulbifer sp. TYP-18]|uniref:CAF17-like 4Fe-4S cluster assembly/insertion protein YgfZ n=1 Tax=Microbulbifer sp. TYP-18 TaxID=3230024 RepID=UPI0034C6063C
MELQQWRDFLSGRGATWDRDQAHFADTGGELQLIDLSPMGAVSVTGADSQKFLQGQFTCDLVNLPDHHTTLGAHCNPKGRVISAFFALKVARDDFVLCMPRDLAAVATAALARYSVFFKADLCDISADHQWLGLQGAEAVRHAAELLGLEGLDSGTVVPFEIDSSRALAFAVSPQQVAILVPRAQAEELWQRLESHAQAASYGNWLGQQIAAGIPQLHTDTSEAFIPQMLNLHVLDGVSFKKGCYTGQEVVARLQYRGATKRRMFRARCEPGPLPTPGTDIRIGEHRPAGEVLTAAPVAGGIELLAVLNNALVAVEDPLCLDDGRALKLLDLPYDADADPLAEP